LRSCSRREQSRLSGRGPRAAAGDERPEYLEIAVAVGLVMDLRRIGEMMLAERLSAAVETAKRQMWPKE
jgi:hypothetical protein